MTRNNFLKLGIWIFGFGISFFPLIAYAHAGLLSADPSPGATVPGPLTETRLTFTEPLVSGSTFTLTTGLFQTVPGLTSVLENDTLRAAFATPLPAGRYTVQWQAVTADGGTTIGSYQFGVGPAARTWVWVGGIVALMALVTLSAIGGGLYWQRARRR